MEDKDYTPVSGMLWWEHGDATPQFITVPIIPSDLYEGDEWFDVEISEAAGGAKFDASSDGSEEKCIARVTIKASGQKNLRQRFIMCCGINEDKMSVGCNQWKMQFCSAVQVGCDEDGEDSKPGCRDYLTHGISLPWKLLFATVPPVIFCGGKLCFLFAIVYIGVLTAFIGDFAAIFGCVIGLKKSVVAITFVALGTSLPDTFASRAAAVGLDSADAAIGNITGSNAVNVFLGLGLAWTCGSIYWAAKGERGLTVHAGDLGFSVIVFCCCAAVCIFLLGMRRRLFGAELGGKWRWASAIISFLLWGAYILLASLKIEGKL